MTLLAIGEASRWLGEYVECNVQNVAAVVAIVSTAPNALRVAARLVKWIGRWVETLAVAGCVGAEAAWHHICKSANGQSPQTCTPRNRRRRRPHR